MKAVLAALLAWFSSDTVIKYGLPTVVALLVIGAPRRLLQWARRRRGRSKPEDRSPNRELVTGALFARLRRLARPTLLIVPAREPGFSKLGGDPELPCDLEWPSGDARPRAFLAQVDLAELPRDRPIDWLPSGGRFYAFYDPDRHDCADVVRILYSREPSASGVPAPDESRRKFVERRVEFERLTSAPSLDWLGLDATELGLDEDELSGVEAVADAPPSDETQHRIGGYPNEIQPERMWLACEHLARDLPDPVWDEAIPPAIARSAKEWRLLLQVDSDTALKMNFGDGGRLYIFIRERHARAADFSKTVSLWQTY